MVCYNDCLCLDRRGGYAERLANLIMRDKSESNLWVHLNRDGECRK